MDNNSQFKPRLAIFFFLSQVVINWVYCLWIKSLPDILINSWFVILPLFGYFYFTFAFIATVGLHYRKRMGVWLAYAVLMFGATSAVISYNIIYRTNYLVEHLIIPLIAINICVIFYLACQQTYFKGD